MNLSLSDYYVIIINILGFFLFVTNSWLYATNSEKTLDSYLTIISLLGGSLGIVISILSFDRKAVKGNMMSRVFVTTVLIIQIIIFLMLKGFRSDNISLAFLDFFLEHRVLVLYLLVINVVTFIFFLIDKVRAIKGKFRIKILTLLMLAFIGGSIGGLIAMKIFNHKIKKDYFSVGLPFIIIAQIFIIFYLMNLP